MSEEKKLQKKRSKNCKVFENAQKCEKNVAYSAPYTYNQSPRLKKSLFRPLHQTGAVQPRHQNRSAPPQTMDPSGSAQEWRWLQCRAGRAATRGYQVREGCVGESRWAWATGPQSHACPWAQGKGHLPYP